MIIIIYILLLLLLYSINQSYSYYNDTNHIENNTFDCTTFIKPILQQRYKCSINTTTATGNQYEPSDQSNLLPITTIDICVVFHGEYEFILPFILHHLSIGIQHIIIYNNDIFVEWYKYPAIECLNKHRLIEIKHHIWEEDFEHNTYKQVKAMNRCYRKDIPDFYDENPTLLDTWGIFLDINDMIVIHNPNPSTNPTQSQNINPQEQCSIVQLVHNVQTSSSSSVVSIAMYVAQFVKYEVNILLNSSYMNSLHGVLLPHEMQFHRKISSSHFKHIMRVGCIDVWKTSDCPAILSYCENEYHSILVDTVGNTLALPCNTVNQHPIDSSAPSLISIDEEGTSNNHTVAMLYITPSTASDADGEAVNVTTVIHKLVDSPYQYIQVNQYVILPNHNHNHHHNNPLNSNEDPHKQHISTFKSTHHHQNNPLHQHAHHSSQMLSEEIQTSSTSDSTVSADTVSQRAYYLGHQKPQHQQHRMNQNNDRNNHTNALSPAVFSPTTAAVKIHQLEKFYRHHKLIPDYSFKQLYGDYLNHFKSICATCFNTTASYSIREYRSNAQSKKWPCESECTAGPYRHTNTCIPTCWDQPMYESQLVSEGCHVVLYTVSFYQNATRLNHVNVHRDTANNTRHDSYRGEARLPYHTLMNSSNTSTSDDGVKVCAIAFVAASSILSQMLRRNNTGYYENWAVIEVDLYARHRESTERSLGNPRKISRLPKISPGLFFASTVHHALYIDSKLEFVEDPLTMMNFKSRRVYDRTVNKKTNNTAVFVAVRHELSKNIYEEVEAIFRVRRTFSRSVTFYPYELRMQAKTYRHLGKLLNMSYVNIFEGAVLLHDLKSIVGYNFRCMWYKEYLLWADRDQISGGYAIANSARIVRNTSTSTPKSRNETVKEWIPLGRNPITNTLEYARLLIPYTYYWGSSYHKRHNFVRIKAGSWHDNLYIPVDHSKVKVEI